MKEIKITVEVRDLDQENSPDNLVATGSVLLDGILQYANPKLALISAAATVIEHFVRGMIQFGYFDQYVTDEDVKRITGQSTEELIAKITRH